MTAQSKNTIKQIVFLTLALIVGEGVLGFGLFWPFLLVLKDKKWIYWIAFLGGIFLSVIYSQKIGLMSIYMILVLALCSLFMGNNRGFGKWLVLISVGAGWMFDYLFGLHFGFGEALLLGLTGFLVSNLMETVETIKINF